MERTDLFVCKCGDVSHQLILSTLDTEDDEKRIVYAAFHLDNYGFWNRVNNAVKYVLGIKHKDGDFDSLLLKVEDMDRLKLFADYLNPCFKDVHQEPVKRGKVKNGSPFSWQNTTICSWRFYSNDNVYIFAVEKHDCLDNSNLSDIESSITVNFKPGNLFCRVRRAVKHVFGYRSCYGDFDSFEIIEEDADRLHDFIKSSVAKM